MATIIIYEHFCITLFRQANRVQHSPTVSHRDRSCSIGHVAFRAASEIAIKRAHKTCAVSAGISDTLFSQRLGQDLLTEVQKWIFEVCELSLIEPRPQRQLHTARVDFLVRCHFMKQPRTQELCSFCASKIYLLYIYVHVLCVVTIRTALLLRSNMYFV
jgi:hypothetical protein